MSGRAFVARDARAVMAPGRPAPAAPRWTGAGGLCRAFAPARVLLGACGCLLAGKVPRSGRTHRAAATVRCRRRNRPEVLPMVWAMAGIGVCMAANGGAAVTSGTLMGLLADRGCLPGVTDAERVALTSLRVSSRDGRALPRGRRLGGGLVPAASLMRVPEWDQQGGSRWPRQRPGAAAQFWRRRRGSWRRRRTTRGWRLTASLLVSSTGLTPARSPRGWLQMRR